MPVLFNKERYHIKEKSQACEEKVIGVDLHPDSFSLAVTVPEDRDSLRVLQQITKAPTSDWKNQLSKLPEPAVIVCEASGNRFEFMKRAEQAGFRSCILNSVDVGRLGKKLCKTDKQDAVRIAKIYRANLASEVWLLDEATRDLREVSSMYVQTVKDSARMINRIKNFLTQHNVRLRNGQKILTDPAVHSLIYKKRNWTDSDLFLLGKCFSRIIPAFRTLMRGKAPDRAARELMGKLHAVRAYASAHKVCTAMVFLGNEDTEVSEYCFSAYRPCEVLQGDNNNWTFVRWVPGEPWNLLPEGIMVGLPQEITEAAVSSVAQRKIHQHTGFDLSKELTYEGLKEAETKPATEIPGSIQKCDLSDTQGLTKKNVSMQTFVVFLKSGLVQYPCVIELREAVLSDGKIKPVAPTQSKTIETKTVRYCNSYYPLVVRKLGRCIYYPDLKDY